MKTKLILTLGIIFGSILSCAFIAQPTFATGESYKWVNESTIEGTGGAYNESVLKNSGAGTTTRATPVEKVTFTRDGTSGVYRAPTENIFYTVSLGGTRGTATCPLQLSLTFEDTTKNASLTLNSTNSDQCENRGNLDTAASLTNESAAPDPTSFTSTNSEQEAEEVSSCEIDGIGWILCPVMNFIGGITDQAYIAVQALLETPPINLNTNANPTYDAWQIMRNIANVAFVIVFLIIIFSQLSSFGVSNYGIKKMLPRLVIAAILVNVSYFICAIAVDISNILGSSLKELFDNISKDFSLTIEDEEVAGIFSGENKWLNIIGAVLAGSVVIGGVVLLHVSILLPILIAALAAIVTVVIVLTLRQALIIILIVISPLAFVAFLLPNTENLFSKWRTLLTTLLLMYPIIAVIFGASAFAGTIIMNSAEGDNAVLVQIMGAGVTIIPLFITPVVMRTAGGLLNRFAGVINNPNKGPFDRMRKGAANVRERGLNKMNNNAMNSNKKFNPRGAYLRRKARINETNENQVREFNRSKTDYVADQYQTNADFMDSATKGSTDGAEERALASAISVQAKLEAEEVTAANAIIENANLNSNQIQQLALGEDVVNEKGEKVDGNWSGINLRQAAIQNKMKTGTLDEAEEIVIASGNINTGDAKQDVRLRQAIAEGVFAGGHNGKANYLGGDMSDRIKAGNIKSGDDLDAAAARRLNKGKFSAELVKQQDPSSLKRFAKVAADGEGGNSDNRVPVESEQLENFAAQASKIMADTELARQITGEQQPHINALKNLDASIKAMNNASASGPPSGPTLAPQPQNYSGVPQQVQEQILTVDHTAPRPNASAPGQAPTTGGYFAGHTKETLQNFGPTNINTTINTAGGAAKLTDADIAKVISATHNVPGAEGLHNTMRAEREFRKTNIPPRE